MPVTWDATAEAKLMAAIFVICDVKVSQPQMKQLADIMGSGCTPKAITHRLSKLRKAGGDVSAPPEGDEPKTKKAKLSPATGKKVGRAAANKRANTPVNSSDDETGARLTPPTTIDRPQRNRGVKRSYEEVSVKDEPVSEDETADDGITVGEDIGEGFRATRPDYRSDSTLTELEEL